jgi:PAS domain S-box-containing protein
MTLKRAARKLRKTATDAVAQREIEPESALSRAALIHELEVHQVELEMQNEELRHAQVDLAAARDRFIDLYDFAPIGYFTLDARGLVREANLTGAAMLGSDRQTLLGRGFSRFVAPAHTGRWHLQMRQAMQAPQPLRIELDMQRSGGESFTGQLDCLPTGQAAKGHALRVALTDISDRKRAETDRRIANDALDAREDERRHVARALHEELAQHLSALKMDVGSLDRNASAYDFGQRIAAMLVLLDDAVRRVRRIAIDLRPPMLDDLGLSAAIEWMAHDASHRLGLDIQVDLQEIGPAPHDREAIATYRMAQDLLHHLAQHAHGCAALITLTREPHILALTVSCRSDVTAFARGEPAFEALAQTLRDRVHMLGGELVFGERGDRHPFITVRLPLTSNATSGPASSPQDQAGAEFPTTALKNK